MYPVKDTAYEELINGKKIMRPDMVDLYAFGGEFDIYIPTIKRVGTIKNLILKFVEEESAGIFVNDGTKYLYDKLSGERIDDNQYIKFSKINNGSKLVLY